MVSPLELASLGVPPKVDPVTLRVPHASARVVMVHDTQAGATKGNGYAGYGASFGINGVSQNKLICQGKLNAGVKTCATQIPGCLSGRNVLFQAAMRDTCPVIGMPDALDLVIQ